MSFKKNYYTRLDVSTTSFDVFCSWNFNSAGLILINESSTTGDVIEYSFDGTTVHGSLDPDLPSNALAFNNRHECEIFFRRQSAGSNVVVRIEAWA